jgi:hypothetical protein
VTATNHILTGAIIGLVVPNPVLAIPLAFASHFVCDALPHFGQQLDALTRNKSRLFRMVLAVDIAMIIPVVTLILLATASVVPSWVITVCMVAAISPDFVWVHRFIREIRVRQIRPLGRFTKFHANIQRYERPWGFIFEFLWFGGGLLLLKRLI